MEQANDPSDLHTVTTYPTDEGYQLECICGWDYFASKASPTKLHPERPLDSFAMAVGERHYISQGIWPYTEHGKPEKNVDGEIVIIHDWPFNKE